MLFRLFLLPQVRIWKSTLLKGSVEKVDKTSGTLWDNAYYSNRCRSERHFGSRWFATLQSKHARLGKTGEKIGSKIINGSKIDGVQREFRQRRRGKLCQGRRSEPHDLDKIGLRSSTAVDDPSLSRMISTKQGTRLWWLPPDLVASCNRGWGRGEEICDGPLQ